MWGTNTDCCIMNQQYCGNSSVGSHYVDTSKNGYVVATGQNLAVFIHSTELNMIRLPSTWLMLPMTSNSTHNLHKWNVLGPPAQNTALCLTMIKLALSTPTFPCCVVLSNPYWATCWVALVANSVDTCSGRVFWIPRKALFSLEMH